MRIAARSNRGISGLIIVLATAFMIILPLGFLGYEFMRYNLVQEELRAVTSAAALAGAVGIATNGGVATNNLWSQDSNAMAAAYDAFCENSLTGCPLYPIAQTGANVNSSEPASTNQPAHFNNSVPWTNVAANTAQVNFVLLDTSGNQTNWSAAAGSSQLNVTSATSLRVDAYFGYTLPILGGLNVGPFTMVATSTGGLPQLDVILCFDVSGSMDDFTNVTFVNRYWVDTRNGTLSSADVTALGLPSTFVGGCIQYDVPQSIGTYGANAPYWTSGSNGYASGPLYYVTACNTRATSYNGTAVNVQPPMNLNQAPLCPQQYWLMSSQRNSGRGNPPGVPATPPATAMTNISAITGSTPAATTITTYGTPAYSDLIVNLSGDAQWVFGAAAAPISGLTFSDRAWAVEASRGNLESSTSLQTAVNPLQATANGDNKFGYIINDATGHHVVQNGFAGISGGGQPGSQAAYWSYVQQNTHPLSDAVNAAENNFFKFLYGSADCHFGLIFFSDGIGTLPNDTWADGAVSPSSAGSINGWTTMSVNGVSATPPVSASIAGHFTGGAGMGAPDSVNPTGVDPDGIDSAGGNTTVPLPLIQLNNAVGYSAGASYDNYASGSLVGNYMVVQNGAAWNGGSTQISVDQSVQPSQPAGIVATGSTDITDALAEAVRELTPANGLTRPNATRAIVLFTDGVPDIDSSNLPPATGAFANCMGDCATQAGLAHSANPPITIFSIGLCMDNQGASPMLGQQSQVLTAITNAANGGPTGQSGWQQITNAAQIQSAFQSISKNLVVITR